VTSNQRGRISQVAWLPNDQLTYGTCAANTTYTKILGRPSKYWNRAHSNPRPERQPGGGLDNTNATVTTGSAQPTWATDSTYPTYTNQTQTAATVNDGSVIWTAINLKNQGIRVLPLPPQGGIYLASEPREAMRPPTFSALSQTLNPILDNYAPYFRQGFISHAYRHASDSKTQAKFKTEFQPWMGAMTEAVKKRDRERDSAGSYLSESLMSSGYPVYPGLAVRWSLLMPSTITPNQTIARAQALLARMSRRWTAL
jgi:hypothetical protein